MANLKPGLIVTLRSGGPRMTVLWDTKDDRVACGYFTSGPLPNGPEFKTVEVPASAVEAAAESDE